MDKTCKTCVAFHCHCCHEYEGECRFYPPDRGNGYTDNFPRVTACAWCTEWEDKFGNDFHTSEQEWINGW